MKVEPHEMQQLLVLMTVVCTDMRHSPSCSQAYRDAEQRKSHVVATWQPAGLCHLYQQPCQLFGAADCEVTNHVHAVQVVRAFRQGACTCNTQTSRGLADLLWEVLLAYRVHVPDNASKVSTPKEHRICTLDTAQLDSRAVHSNFCRNSK